MPKLNLKKAFTVAELVLTLFLMSAIVVGSINVSFKKTRVSNKMVSDHADIRNYFECNENRIETENQKIDEHGGFYGRFSDGTEGCDFYVQKPGGSANTKRKLNEDSISYYIPPEIQSREFLTVTLKGGGAGGGDKSGENGETRTIYMPSLMFPFGRNTKDQREKCGNLACTKCNVDEKKGKECTECVKGYIVRNHVCEPNFKYRAIIGKGGDEKNNGGQTSLLVVTLEDKDTGNPDRSANKSKILGVIETAAGGFTTVEKVRDKSDNVTEETGETVWGLGGNPGQSGKAGEVKIEW